jgi:ubiquinone/menaquinone biosynthesis C-methylase UbiE
MAKTAAFEKNAPEYEAWFEHNKIVFRSELQAVREQLPKKGEGVEVGVGSGQFAALLGIRLGIDPSPRMRKLAQSRGVMAIDGTAEKLPFDGDLFGFVLMVTTICFVDDIKKSFEEAFRILKPGGHVVIGFLDKNSPVGRMYHQRKKMSKFYNTATFYAADEVVFHLKRAGFKNPQFKQTIFQSMEKIKKLEPVKKGYGEGSFVVVKALKPRHR